MNAVQVRCPQCGATLRAGDDARVICEYCGTEAHVQRRSRVRDRVIAPPVRLPDGARIATQIKRASWVFTGIVFGVIAIVMGAITCVMNRAVEQAKVKASTRGGGTTPSPGRFLSWEGTSGGGALIADADGDGDLDAIGRCRELGNADAVSLIALDGATGATLWETPKLGTYIETYQGSLALAGDTLLFASDRAEITAYSLAGARLWSATMPERVKHFCAGGTALGTDGVARPLRTVEAATAPTSGECVMLPHDHHGGDLTVKREDPSYELYQPLGLGTAQLVVGPTGARVLSGDRAKGTRVARLIAIDELGKERWSTDVPIDPFAAEEGKADLVVVGADVTCAVYELIASGAMPRLVCFTLADGARRWDVELLDDSVLEGLAITDLGVMVSMWGLLEVRDPADGKLRWKYGRD